MASMTMDHVGHGVPNSRTKWLPNLLRSAACTGRRVRVEKHDEALQLLEILPGHQGPTRTPPQTALFAHLGVSVFLLYFTNP